MSRKNPRHIYKPNIYYWDLGSGERRISAFYNEYPDNINRCITVVVGAGEDFLAALHSIEQQLREARAEQHRKRRADTVQKELAMTQALIEEARIVADEIAAKKAASVLKSASIARADVKRVWDRYGGMTIKVLYSNVYGEEVFA